jgi:hypothetical protein
LDWAWRTVEAMWLHYRLYLRATNSYPRSTSGN